MKSPFVRRVLFAALVPKVAESTVLDHEMVSDNFNHFFTCSVFVDAHVNLYAFSHYQLDEVDVDPTDLMGHDGEHYDCHEDHDDDDDDDDDDKEETDRVFETDRLADMEEGHTGKKSRHRIRCHRLRMHRILKIVLPVVGLIVVLVIIVIVAW